MLFMDMLFERGMLLKDIILLGIFRGGASGAGWSSGKDMVDHGRSRAGMAAKMNLKNKYLQNMEMYYEKFWKNM